MSNEQIAAKLVTGYKERREVPSYEHGFSRSSGTTGMLFVEIDGEVHSITKQALADEAGDDLASLIWHWVQP